MTIFGRIHDDGSLVEFVTGDPVDQYHPDVRWSVVPEHLVAFVTEVKLIDNNGVAEPVTHGEFLAALCSLVAAKRFQVETGGLVLADGASIIKTDRESQSQLTSILARMTRDPSLVVDFKSPGGWIVLDKAMAESIDDAATAFLQACFSREKAIHTVLLSKLDDTVAMVEAFNAELAQGWPENSYSLLSHAAAVGVL